MIPKNPHVSSYNTRRARASCYDASLYVRTILRQWAADPRLPLGFTSLGPTMSYRILVVDDEPAIHQFLHRVLTRQGYTVTTAGDGEEALRVVANRRPHLLTTDLQMPRMDGHTLIRHLRHDYPALPIIIITAAMECVELPGIPMLLKPIAIQQLLTVIHEQLAVVK